MEILLSTLFGLIRLIGVLLFGLWLWVPLVGYLGFLIYQNMRKQKWVSDSRYSLLLIEVPKDNEKQELSAEQMFASLHGILRNKKELIREGAIQEHVSFEIVSVEKRIRFYVWTPHHLQNFVEGRIYAQYPTVNIHEVTQDYAKQDIGDLSAHSMELSLTNNDVIPIQTFKNFEVDPLAGITAVLAKLEEAGEQVWIQILARPIDDGWQAKGERYIKNLRNGNSRGEGFFGLLTYIARHFISALIRPPEDSSSKSASEMSEQQKATATAVSEKISKLGYEVKIRLVHIGPDKNTSKLRIQSLVGAFKQFNNTNGFKVGSTPTQDEALTSYKARLFAKKGFILNIEELASLYHLPHKNVETPSMVWATSKTAEPPSNLPSVEETPAHELSPIGATNFRGHNAQFGFKRSDRGRHVYILGQTGTGKSGLLQLLTLSDIYQNEGFAVIDPHGDLATSVMDFIPENRVEDVIYFNPADTEYPIAFNPLEVTDPALKNHISSEVVGVLKRMFGESWGPRLEYILRYTILALLDTPKSTMLGITRMLTGREYRKKVIKNIQDPVVRNFWVTEFASWNEKFASEAVAPVLNKVGAFTANPLIRNVIGQPTSAFNLRKLMDEGKILIVNLSRGQVGEDNAAILGALMVTKIQLAAMSRANVALEERRPFYLYVDEFQNFATDSFAVILSEARKYGLNLTVANQYVAQMPLAVRDAVFGNVGTMVCFRIGADDGNYLSKYFAPTFEPQDLINLNNLHFVVSMSIEGEKVPPSTGTSLRLPAPSENHSQAIINLSRERFSRERTIVEEKISRWSQFEIQEQNTNNHSASKNHPRASKSHQSNKSEHKRHQAPKAAETAAKPAKRHNNELEPEQTISLRK